MLKKSLSLIIVMTILGVLFYLVLKDPKNRDSVLLVGTSADNQPYEFFRDGEIVGFDIDLVYEIGEILNKEIEIVDMDFNGLIPALQADRLDIVIAGMTPTSERVKHVDFSIPYLISQSAIVSLKKHPIHGIEDLKNKTVAAQLGSHHETNTRSLEVSGLTVKAYTRIPDMIQELKSSVLQQSQPDSISGIVIGLPEAIEIVKLDPSFTYAELPINDNCAIVLKKGSEFTTLMNKAIETLKEDKVIAQLQQKWGINTPAEVSP